MGRLGRARRPRRCGRRSCSSTGGAGTAVLVTDLALASAAVLATRFVDDPGRIAQGAQTLPSIWPGAVVVTWARLPRLARRPARRRRHRGGRPRRAGRRRRAHRETVNNIVLLALTGLVVGYGCSWSGPAAPTSRRRSRCGPRPPSASGWPATSTTRCCRCSASCGAARPTARRRSGTSRRLAGEQEARLRALVSTGPARPAPTGSTDLGVRLASYERPDVTVSRPAGAVLLPAPVAAAVAAAVGAALDNVAGHAGPGARRGCWWRTSRTP